VAPPLWCQLPRRPEPGPGQGRTPADGPPRIGSRAQSTPPHGPGWARRDGGNPSRPGSPGDGRRPVRIAPRVAGGGGGTAHLDVAASDRDAGPHHDARHGARCARGRAAPCRRAGPVRPRWLADPTGGQGGHSRVLCGSPDHGLVGRAPHVPGPGRRPATDGPRRRTVAHRPGRHGHSSRRAPRGRCRRDAAVVRQHRRLDRGGLDGRFARTRRFVRTDRRRRPPLGRGHDRRRARAGRCSPGDRGGWRVRGCRQHTPRGCARRGGGGHRCGRDPDRHVAPVRPGSRPRASRGRRAALVVRRFRGGTGDRWSPGAFGEATGWPRDAVSSRTAIRHVGGSPSRRPR
jgi:hypothetical protein